MSLGPPGKGRRHPLAGVGRGSSRRTWLWSWTIKGRPLPGGPGPTALPEREGSSRGGSGAEPHRRAPAGRVSRLRLGRHSDTPASFLGHPAADSRHLQAVGPQGPVPPHPPPWAPESGHLLAGLQALLASRTATHGRSLAQPHAGSRLFARGALEPRLAVSCACKARALRGCGRGDFRPRLGSCCRAGIRRRLCHWSFGLFQAQCGALPTHRGRSVPSPHGGHAHQLRGPPGPRPSWPALHAERGRITGLRLCFILPAACLAPRLPLLSRAHAFPRPVLAGRAAGHPGSGPPTILSLGGQCLAAMDSQHLSWAVGNRAHFWNTSSPKAGPRLLLHGCTER